MKTCISVPGFVGTPKLNFFEAMELEHNDDREFESANYHVKTNPRKEWQVVVDQKLTDEAEDVRREVKNIGELKEQFKIRREEVIAVVLYSGPMVNSYA